MEKKIQVTEDQVLAEINALVDLVRAKEAEGYVITGTYNDEARGKKVVVMMHRNYMDKTLSHRDYLEKGRRGL
jgi:ribosomal protein L21